MNATTLLQNLRALLGKQDAQPTPAETLAKAQTDLAALVGKEDVSPTALRAVAAELTKLAAALEPPTPAEKVDVTKAELDAYTAARATTSTIHDAAYGMSDALRCMDMVKFGAFVTMLQGAVAGVAGMVASPAAPGAAAPAAAPAAGEVTANAKSDKETTMTREEFVAWALTQIEDAKKADTVEKATAIIAKVAKGVEVAKLAFVDQQGPVMSVDWMEAFPGTGGPGAAKMDLTAKTDQSTSESNAFKPTGSEGDSAFAVNAGAVLKALEQLIAKVSPEAPKTEVTKSAGSEFVWPLDMNTSPEPEEREAVAKNAATGDVWGGDPWKPSPSFPQVR